MSGSHIRRYNPASGEGVSHTRDYLIESLAENGSRNLLIAQLKAGQHSLHADAFYGRVKELRAQGHKL